MLFKVFLERIFCSSWSSFSLADSMSSAFVDKRSVTSPVLAYGAMVGSVWLSIKSDKTVTSWLSPMPKKRKTRE